MDGIAVASTVLAMRALRRAVKTEKGQAHNHEVLRKQAAWKVTSVCQNTGRKKKSPKTTRLPNKASIFRAELHAISLALSLIRRSKEKNFIIFSDSMSSLEAISVLALDLRACVGCNNRVCHESSYLFP